MSSNRNNQSAQKSGDKINKNNIVRTDTEVFDNTDLLECMESIIKYVFFCALLNS